MSVDESGENEDQMSIPKSFGAVYNGFGPPAVYNG